MSDLRAILANRGMSLADLARAMDVNKSTVTRWMQRRLPAERALAIEKRTGIRREELRPDLFKTRRT